MQSKQKEYASCRLIGSAKTSTKIHITPHSNKHSGNGHAQLGIFAVTKAYAYMVSTAASQADLTRIRENAAANVIA